MSISDRNEYDASFMWQSSVKSPNPGGYRLEFQQESEEKSEAKKVRRTESFPIEKLIESVVEHQKIRMSRDSNQFRGEPEHVIEAYSFESVEDIREPKTDWILPEVKSRESIKKAHEFMTPAHQPLYRNISEQQTLEQYRRKIYELEEKLRKSSIELDTKRFRSEEQSKVNDEILRKKITKMQQEIIQLKLQKEDAAHQILKHKNIVIQRQHQIELRAQQHGYLLKQIKSIKDQLDEALSRERKAEMNLKLQMEKHEQETIQMTNQIKRQKQEMAKLRQLLKNSEEQLKQCENFISSVNTKLKSQDEQIQLSNNKHKEEKLKYYNKLQYFDNALLQVENCLSEMAKNQGEKTEHLKNKELELQSVKEQLMKKEVDLKCIEQQLQDTRRQLKHEFMKLQRKEEGLMAQYQMAIDVQNASKEKWYKKYYEMFSDRKEGSIYSSSPSIVRQNHVINLRPPHLPRKNVVAVPVRQRSPRTEIKDYKVRSEYNIRMKTSGQDFGKPKSKRVQLKSPQSFRDFSISSRINNLRKQLDKELKQTTLR